MSKAGPPKAPAAAGGLFAVMKFDDGSTERIPLHEYLQMRDRAMVDVGRLRQRRETEARLERQRRDGAAKANSKRAKFPQDARQLLAEVEQVMRERPSLTEAGARGVVARRYGGTLQRLGQILSKVR